MVSYYRAFAPKSEAVKYMDYRATLSETAKFFQLLPESQGHALLLQRHKSIVD